MAITRYGKFLEGSPPRPGKPKRQSLFEYYFHYLPTYLWCSGNPNARAKFKNHEGMKAFRKINWLLYIGFVIVILLMAAYNNSCI